MQINLVITGIDSKWLLGTLGTVDSLDDTSDLLASLICSNYAITVVLDC
jgi:hypothetical protein